MRRGLLIGGSGRGTEEEEVDEVSSMSTSSLPSENTEDTVATESASSTSTSWPRAALSCSSIDETVIKLGTSLMLEEGASTLQII